MRGWGFYFFAEGYRVDLKIGRILQLIDATSLGLKLCWRLKVAEKQKAACWTKATIFNADMLSHLQKDWIAGTKSN